MTVKRKRFIAGAVCPHCQSKDTLALWRDGDVDSVICVKCGFTERRADGTNAEKRPAQEQIIGIFHPD
ncbi:YheV family putative zinc ribbon protein [Acerihabitans sp. KWT182]|uniref:YheV family putative zinc ribbon protein n=1 Tax=Acerihabitans sp. KWT182 TaxID=3157919 RepID=A0AAU7QAR9_9GAMM